MLKKVCKITIFNKNVGHSYRLNVNRPLYLSQESVETTRSSKTTDIYLAGESGDDIRWREDIAIPMIKYIFNNIVVCLITSEPFFYLL